jgi:hypothetical protein
MGYGDSWYCSLEVIGLKYGYHFIGLNVGRIKYGMGSEKDVLQCQDRVNSGQG